MIYLDHAATAPVPPEVADAVRDALVNTFGNPSSQHDAGRKAKALVDRSRQIVAQALGCEEKRLVFTSCGTESDNWAIRLAVRQGRRRGRHIVTTAVEHSAVLETCRLLEQEGCRVTYLKPDRNGAVTSSQVLAALCEDTVLVSLMLVNNETGCVFPVSEVAEALRGTQVLLHTDAVQGFLQVPFRASALGADLISVSGHKLGAPKGVGALYIGERVRNPLPLLAGGGQEFGLRSGTEATAQLAGFARAAELRLADPEGTRRRMERLKAYGLERLLALPHVERIGAGTAPHIISVSLVGYPSSNAVEELAAQGICISAGSACHRGRASHVFEAMGLPKAVKAGAIRISLGPDTQESELDRLAEALAEHMRKRFPLLV